MPFFSSWIKVIFFTALAFFLYSGNSLPLVKRVRKRPNCDAYKGRLNVCSNQVDPICAGRGRTFYNECVFCSVVLDSYRPPKFRHYGRCPDR